MKKITKGKLLFCTGANALVGSIGCGSGPLTGNPAPPPTPTPEVIVGNPAPPPPEYDRPCTEAELLDEAIFKCCGEEECTGEDGFPVAYPESCCAETDDTEDL